MAAGPQALPGSAALGPAGLPICMVLPQQPQARQVYADGAGDTGNSSGSQVCSPSASLAPGACTSGVLPRTVPYLFQRQVLPMRLFQWRSCASQGLSRGWLSSYCR